MFKPFGLAALAAGTLLMAGCNDGPTSIAIPTPVPLSILEPTNQLTFANASGLNGTIRTTRVQLIPSRRQLVITGTFESLNAAPVPPSDASANSTSTAVQIRQTVPTPQQPNPANLSGLTRLFLDVTQAGSTTFSGTFSGILEFTGPDADREIEAVRRGEFYLNFTTVGNNSASASRVQIRFN